MMTANKQRRKTTRNFFFMVLGGGILGGIMGMAASRLSGSMLDGAAALSHALLLSAPYAAFAIGGITILGSFLLIGRAKSLAGAWSEENEDFYQRMEQPLSLAMSFSSVGTILQVTWFGPVTLALQSGLCSPPLYFSSTFFFVLAVIIHSFLLRRAIELTKELNPEKKGDPLEIHFQKKWLESCDEQERLHAYQAAYKAFSILPVLSLSIFVLLFLGIFYFDIGLLPFLLVGLMWLVPSLVYLWAASQQKPQR